MIILQPEPGPRVAVVGAGVAGLSTVVNLYKSFSSRAVALDVFEADYVPGGLIRYGVAPDNRATKFVGKRLFEQCNDIFDHKASSCITARFFGGVTIASDSWLKSRGWEKENAAVSLESLRSEYDAVVLCTGAGLPGESVTALDPGQASTSAMSTRQFIQGCYNGFPLSVGGGVPFVSSLQELGYRTTKAVIFGQGNVAADVIERLIKGDSGVMQKEVTEHGLQFLSSLAKPPVTDIFSISRHHPLKSKWTTDSLRAIMNLANVFMNPEDLKKAQALPSAEKTVSRRSERLLETAAKNLTDPSGLELHKPRVWLLFEDSLASFAEGTVKLGSGNVIEGIDICLESRPWQQEQIRFLTGPTEAEAVFKAGWASTGGRGNAGATVVNAKDVAAKVFEHLQATPRRRPKAANSGFLPRAHKDWADAKRILEIERLNGFKLSAFPADE